jgi:hypothetical protein
VKTSAKLQVQTLVAWMTAARVTNRATAPSHRDHIFFIPDEINSVSLKNVTAATLSVGLVYEESHALGTEHLSPCWAGQVSTCDVEVSVRGVVSLVDQTGRETRP